MNPDAKPFVPGMFSQSIPQPVMVLDQSGQFLQVWEVPGGEEGCVSREVVQTPHMMGGAMQGVTKGGPSAGDWDDSGRAVVR